MEDKITIIEGPSPTLEPVKDGWVLGLNESPVLADLVVTRLRTFNGPALVERCHKAWRHNRSIHLEFNAPDGLHQNAPIVAARSVEKEEGQILLLWLRLPEGEIELEFDFDDDFDDDEYEDFNPFDNLT